MYLYIFIFRYATAKFKIWILSSIQPRKNSGHDTTIIFVYDEKKSIKYKIFIKKKNDFVILDHECL